MLPQLVASRTALHVRAASAVSALLYPLGVTAAGLEPVFDHRTDTGPTASITQRTSVNGTPSGWPGADTTSGGSKLFYEPVAGFTLSQQAFDNGQLLGRGTSSLTDGYLNNPGVTTNESICHSVGNLATETATYSRVYVDGTGMVIYDNVGGTLHLGNVNLIGSAAGSSFTANHSKFSNAPNVNVKGHNVILNHCFVGTFLNAPYPGTGAGDQSHGESMFIEGGTWGIRNTIVDSTDKDTDPNGLYTTAIIFMQTSGANITADLTGAIVRGTKTQNTNTGGLLSPIQLSAKTGHTLTLTVTGCAIEKGSLSGRDGYILVSEQQDANSVHIIDGGGNYDLLTGLACPSLTYQ